MIGFIMKLFDVDKDIFFYLSDIVFWSEKDLFGLCVSGELFVYRLYCRIKIRSLKKKKKIERGKILFVWKKYFFIFICIIFYR